MNEFLELNPKYEYDAKLFRKMERKVVFKDIPSLNTRLTLIKLPLFKILLYNDFYKSNELKRTYEEIIKKEYKEGSVETMIFQILCGKKVHFSDITLKFLFYKEFADKKDLFVNSNTGLIFEVQDLFFKQVYLHENTLESIEKLVRGAPLQDKVFLILSLRRFLSHKFIKEIVYSIKQPDTIKYWAISLRSLRDREFYAIVTSEIVYSSFAEKVLILRSIEKTVNPNKLSVCILKECISSERPVVKMYVVFLKVIELMVLPHEFKVKLLYCWIRYFLYKKHIELFFDLMASMRKSRKGGDELEFYIEFEKYLKGEAEFSRIEELSQGISDENQPITITIGGILEKYRK